MKKLLFLLLIPFLFGCEMYEETTYPGLYMSGGRWTLTSYDIVITSSVSPITILKSDTVCINTFSNLIETPDGVIMKQNYNNTTISRRFIKNKTVWEFDGSHLFCAWVNTPGGMKPAHDPFWVSYPGYGYSHMEILDETTGTSTTYSFSTYPNFGVTPPSQLTMVGPDIVASFYSSGRAYDKAVIYHVVLNFMRN